MKLDDAIAIAKTLLKRNNIPSLMDAEFIMSYLLEKQGIAFSVSIDITKSLFRKYMSLIKKRIKRIPIDKIIGYTEFMGLKIPFSRNVLTPRQETEILTDIIIKDIGKKNIDVLDLCSGSGCIGLAIAKHTNALVFASDISRKALSQIQNNARTLDAKITIVNSNLFDNIYTKFDIIVCNPPYINKLDMQSLEKEVKHYDPKLALYGGEDGLDFYRKIIEDAPKFLKDNGKIYFEIGYDQANSIKSILEKDFVDILVIKDYSQIDRFIVAKKRDKYAK